MGAGPIYSGWRRRMQRYATTDSGRQRERRGTAALIIVILQPSPSNNYRALQCDLI